MASARMATMLPEPRVDLPSGIPVEGCQLKPYTGVYRPHGGVQPDGVPEFSAPSDGFHLQHKWYRSEKSTPVCSVHQSELATLQCVCCLKAKAIDVRYHCSTECYAESWRQHVSLHHTNAKMSAKEERHELVDIFVCRFAVDCVDMMENMALLGQKSGLKPFCEAEQSKNWERIWVEVGQNRTYTPCADDVGHMLKLQCTAVDATTGQPLSPTNIVMLARVIPLPSSTPRRMVPLDFEDNNGAAGQFTILSYNVLADIYVRNDARSYCPSWALSWAYRRQILLREIVGYNADILCLQEVQSDHFTEFFEPELEKHGYAAIYKKKASEIQ